MEQDEPVGAAEQELPPFVIEGARSGRSRCKVCRRAINKGVLRLGVLIEGPYGTGYLWHHLACAARRRFDAVEEAYAAEAWNAASVPPPTVPSLDELRKLREEAEEQRKGRKQIPYVEAAPSGRAKCKQCAAPIDKDSLRVVLGRGVFFGTQVRTSPIHVHPQCVTAALRAEDCTTQAEGLVEALRANSSGIDPDALAAALQRIAASA
jgi:hypothetical protein